MTALEEQAVVDCGAVDRGMAAVSCCFRQGKKMGFQNAMSLEGEDRRMPYRCLTSLGATVRQTRFRCIVHPNAPWSPTLAWTWNQGSYLPPRSSILGVLFATARDSSVCGPVSPFYATRANVLPQNPKKFTWFPKVNKSQPRSTGAQLSSRTRPLGFFASTWKVQPGKPTAVITDCLQVIWFSIIVCVTTTDQP